MPRRIAFGLHKFNQWFSKILDSGLLCALETSFLASNAGCEISGNDDSNQLSTDFFEAG